MLVTDVQETSFRRFSNATGAYVVTLPNYESGGRRFESLPLRHINEINSLDEVNSDVSGSH